MASSDSSVNMDADLQFESDSPPPPPPPSPEMQMEVTSDETYKPSTESSSTDSWTMDESPDDVESYTGLYEVVDAGESLFDLGAAPGAAHRLLETNHQRYCRECRFNIKKRRLTYTYLICDVCIVAVCGQTHLQRHHVRM